MGYFQKLKECNYKGLVRVNLSNGDVFRFSMEQADFEIYESNNMVAFSTLDEERVALNLSYVVSVTTQK